MIRTADTFQSWHSKLELSNRQLSILGGSVIAAVFGGFVLWGSLAPIAGAVVAPGVMIASGQSKTIQHLEGGIIESILVHEGEAVKAGQTIIKLSETAALANLTRMTSQHDAMRAIEARYLAERDGKEAISFPPDLLARKDDPSVKEVVDGQQREFATRRESLMSEISVLEKQIAATEEQIAGLEAQREAADRQSALIAEELKDTRGLFEQGLAQKTRVLALERAGAEMLGNKGQLTAQIAQARQSIAETQNRIISTRQNWMEKAVSELRDVQLQVADLGERVKAAQDVATRTEIKAPVDGKLVKLHYYTVGGVIGPGQPIAELLPLAGQQIEARIHPTDISRVHAGVQTRLRFPALRERTTPTLHGDIDFISPDRLTDPRTGEPYYVARVKLADDLAEDEKHVVSRLMPGMPVEVYVQTGDRTFFGYLFGPVTDIVEHSFREP